MSIFTKAQLAVTLHAESTKASINKTLIFAFSLKKMQIGVFYARISFYEKKIHFKFLSWLLFFISVQI